MRRAFSAHADRGADALAERSGRHVHERQPRRRVPLQVGIDPPQLQQLGAIERAGLGPRRVEQRRRVSLRENEPVAARVLRVLRIEAHLGEEERRDEIRGRKAARRMSAAGLGSRARRIDPQTRRDVLESRNELRSIDCHGSASLSRGARELVQRDADDGRVLARVQVRRGHAIEQRGRFRAVVARVGAITAARRYSSSSCRRASRHRARANAQRVVAALDVATSVRSCSAPAESAPPPASSTAAGRSGRTRSGAPSPPRRARRRLRPLRPGSAASAEASRPDGMRCRRRAPARRRRPR